MKMEKRRKSVEHGEDRREKKLKVKLVFQRTRRGVKRNNKMKQVKNILF